MEIIAESGVDTREERKDPKRRVPARHRVAKVSAPPSLVREKSVRATTPRSSDRPAGTSTYHTSLEQSASELPVKQNHQEVGWESRSDEWIRPKGTVNERLNQARMFLSDEDVNLTLNFENRRKQIDNYLRKLADEEIECDLGVYNEVQDMLRVHQARIDRQKNQGLELTRHLPAASLSQRLSLGEIDHRTAIPGAPLRDDHPPFITERPPDLGLFLRTLHGPTAQGQKLRKLENEGRQEVLKKPVVVKDALEERGLLSRDEIFDIRARKRGRRRAAIEIALRSFATNDEQHYQGGWQHNSLRLPSKPMERRPDSVLTVSTGKENEGQYTPPYRWTKRYLAFRKHQKSARLSGAKERTLQELAQPLSETQQVFSEDRAVELIEDAILKELHEDRAPRKNEYTHDWSLVAKSPDLDRTVNYFMPGRWQPALKESAVAAKKKRKAEEALAAEPAPKRSHFAMVYSPLGSPSDPPSRRLPAEELGFEEHREGSHEQTPDIGAGGLMPPEMKQFDYRRDGMALEDAPDRKEKHYPGEASFMFGETGYLSALMSREIEMVVQGRRHAQNQPRNRNPEVGHKPEPIKGPPSPAPPLVLPSEKFPLPPLERAQGYQGRFPLPPGSIDQRPSRPSTPPSPFKLLTAGNAPSSPKSSPSSPSPTSPKSLSPQSPHHVHGSKYDRVASNKPPWRRPKPILPPPAPFVPPAQPYLSTPTTSSKLRLEYALSRKGQLSPHHPEQKQDSNKAEFEDSEESDEERGKNEKEEEEVDQDQDQDEEEDRNELYSDSGSQESSISNDDDSDEDEDEGEENSARKNESRARRA